MVLIENNHTPYEIINYVEFCITELGLGQLL